MSKRPYFDEENCQENIKIIPSALLDLVCQISVLKLNYHLIFIDIQCSRVKKTLYHA